MCLVGRLNINDKNRVRKRMAVGKKALSGRHDPLARILFHQCVVKNQVQLTTYSSTTFDLLRSITRSQECLRVFNRVLCIYVDNA